MNAAVLFLPQVCRRKPGIPGSAALLLVTMLSMSPAAFAETVQVPVNFGSAYLTRLLQQTIFNDDAGLSVWGDSSGCNDLTLSAPNAVIENEKFYVITEATAVTGIAIGRSCIGLLNWHGRVKAEQRVDIIDPAGRIAFSTVDTELLKSQGGRARVSNTIWNLVKGHVHPHLDRLRIDLVGAIAELRILLPLFFENGNVERNRNMADSVHLTGLSVGANGVGAAVQFDIELDQAPDRVEPEAPLSEYEAEQFIDTWERWDAFLVFMVKVAARNIIDDEQKDLLLDALIETRYGLVEVLSDPEAVDATPVRRSFLQAWRQLGPVFRNLSQNTAGPESLRLLGFVAAVDALQALDQLGPATGWDISVDGLRRLARMLIEYSGDTSAVDPLAPQVEVDPEMRELFNFDRNLRLPPAFNVLPDEDQTEPASLLNHLFRLLPAAHARPGLDLNTTVPGKENLQDYLPRVKELLTSVTYGTLMTHPLAADYRTLFYHLVLTTAWQETCWRQFQKKNGKIAPIVSSAGALGMMQIMPRVWRGFYDSKSLAGDIEYNAAAGTEILYRYLVRYAIRKGEHQQKGGIENLARASYAAYNGGPKHLTRYRSGDTSKSLKAIDDSFWSKFRQVRDGDLLAVQQCYPDFQ